MKTVNWFLIMLTFISTSCTDDIINENTDTFWIESYNGSYANFPMISTVYPPNDNLVKFQYDNRNRIIRKTGDMFYASPNAGFSGYLSDSLYTDLRYYENKVDLTKKISPLGHITPTHESTVTFDTNNRMIVKTRKVEIYGEIRKDTTLFTYAENKLTEFTKTYNVVTEEGYDIRFSESSVIHYSNGNADSIVTIFSRKYSDTPYTVLEKKQTEIFDNYDAATNPFRKLQIFEETFSRSLSNNNYRQYKRLEQIYIYPDFDFYQQAVLYWATEVLLRNWNLSYDNNGEWIYNHAH